MNSKIKKFFGKFTKKAKRTVGIWYGIDEKDKSFVLEDKDKNNLKETLQEYMGIVKKLARQQEDRYGIGNSIMVAGGLSSEDAAKYMYDFYAGVSNRSGVVTGLNPYDTPAPVTGLTTPVEADDNGNLSFDSPISEAAGRQNIRVVKKKVTPKEVRCELEMPATKVALEFLEEKIKLVKGKLELIKSNHYSKNELEAMIERLENRKKYNEEIESFFLQLKPTSDEKIEDLLKKYELVMDTSDIYVPDFPEEAITIMQKYTEHCSTLCNKKPIFYVIATEDYFKVKRAQRDPILLAQSPFGFYWYILGAWDKELIFLPEL